MLFETKLEGGERRNIDDMEVGSLFQMTVVCKEVIGKSRTNERKAYRECECAMSELASLMVNSLGEVFVRI